MSNEIERRFIKSKLEETAKGIADGSARRMSSFRSQFWKQRSFAVSDNTLQYTHLKVHRFVDMKTRKVNNIPVKKKNYPVHNKIVMGNYGQLVKELSFGFTEEVKKKFREMQ